MRGIQIRDMNESGHALAVDLRHLLDLLGERTIRSRWIASAVWAIPETGEAARELERLADGHTSIAGEHLSRLAHRLVQVIDGEFSAFERDHDAPWIMIRAVDSSSYEVFATEPAVLDLLRLSFRQVTDCHFVA